MPKAEKHNPGGIHTHFGATKAFLRWYEREFEPPGWHNPVAKLKAPKVPEKQLKPADFQDVLAMIGKRDKAMMLTLMDVGVRASELLAIQLDDIGHWRCLGMGRTWSL